MKKKENHLTPYEKWIKEIVHLKWPVVILFILALVLVILIDFFLTD
ncbi:MAG TPA: hypothetical protein VGA21_01245 [Cyclobacteriaceae bacterium]|jgi:hypothetical protein